MQQKGKKDLAARRKTEMKYSRETGKGGRRGVRYNPSDHFR